MSTFDERLTEKARLMLGGGGEPALDGAAAATVMAGKLHAAPEVILRRVMSVMVSSDRVPVSG
ncbi:hypothetical protein [Dermacoccus nishinomiyaensis]|uniref:hypothetical protein n=1 Tax=Dermacoccus nishinomiyaensis TaxID=1274 RepID=UPI00248ECA5D|nr:hypothetical protein [Dermacoccus nishinomiyaensis]